MRAYLAVFVLAVCAACSPYQEAPRAQNAMPTPLKQATLPLITPQPTATPAEVLQAPVSVEWSARAVTVRDMAELAIVEKHWEDQQFKESGYRIIGEMVELSSGKLQEDSNKILKHFRWGMEMMDKGNLEDVISIIDRYD